MLRHRYMKNTGSLRRITFGILFWSMANGIYAQTTPGMQPEWLSYDVIYQLGFLWKRAATATLQLTEYPDKYTSVLKAPLCRQHIQSTRHTGIRYAAKQRTATHLLRQTR